MASSLFHSLFHSSSLFSFSFSLSFSLSFIFHTHSLLFLTLSLSCICRWVEGAQVFQNDSFETVDAFPYVKLAKFPPERSGEGGSVAQEKAQVRRHIFNLVRDPQCAWILTHGDFFPVKWRERDSYLRPLVCPGASENESWWTISTLQKWVGQDAQSTTEKKNK